MFHHPGLSGGPSPGAGGPCPLPTHSGLPPPGNRYPQEWRFECPSTPGTLTAGWAASRRALGPPLHTASGSTSYLCEHRPGRWSWSPPLLSSCRARPGVSTRSFRHDCPAGRQDAASENLPAEGVGRRGRGNGGHGRETPTTTTRTPDPARQTRQALTLAALRAGGLHTPPHDSGRAYNFLCVTLGISLKIQVCKLF